MKSDSKAKTDHSDFFDKVFKVVREIPPGRVTSYGAIASFLSIKRASRMVGWALNSSDWMAQGIPAHRVVNRKGLLTGKRYFGGEHTMEDMLRSEGIEVEDNQIVEFEKYFWDPEKELL